MNKQLKEYFEMFGELPFLLTTQSYDDDDYKILMIQAVNRGKPLTEEEIAKYFKNDYDIVDDKKFTNFGRK